MSHSGTFYNHNVQVSYYRPLAYNLPIVDCSFSYTFSRSSNRNQRRTLNIIIHSSINGNDNIESRTHIVNPTASLHIITDYSWLLLANWIELSLFAPVNSYKKCCHTRHDTTIFTKTIELPLGDSCQSRKDLKNPKKNDAEPSYSSQWHVTSVIMSLGLSFRWPSTSKYFVFHVFRCGSPVTLTNSVIRPHISSTCLKSLCLSREIFCYANRASLEKDAAKRWGNIRFSFKTIWQRWRNKWRFETLFRYCISLVSTHTIGCNRTGHTYMVTVTVAQTHTLPSTLCSLPKTKGTRFIWIMHQWHAVLVYHFRCTQTGTPAVVCLAFSVVVACNTCREYAVFSSNAKPSSQYDP